MNQFFCHEKKYIKVFFMNKSSTKRGESNVHHNTKKYISDMLKARDYLGIFLLSKMSKSC